MVEEDFDIDRLAAYLHLLPAQVMRLAERGRIPGRKVGGRWRFSPGEIHHWLEEKIGLSDESELVEMESLLERTTPAPESRPVVISQLLPVDTIAVPLPARTRTSVIHEMTQLAARTGLLWDADKMAEAIQAREAMQPTALDTGVALLHPRRPMPSILGQELLALGITRQGIAFGGSGATPTDIFFLICSVDDQGHLRTLARLSRLLCTPGFLDALRQAPDAPAAHETIEKFESQLG